MVYKISLIYNYFLFESSQMRNRNKYDWSKPFKFVASKEEFDSIETNDDNLVVSVNNE